MYQIKDENGDVIAQVDSPRYIKMHEENQCWIRCQLSDAQALAVNGKVYSIFGRELIEGAPPVFVQEVDAAAEQFRSEFVTKLNSNDITNLAWALNKMAAELIEMLNTKEDI